MRTNIIFFVSLCCAFFAGHVWAYYPTYTSVIHCRGACGAQGQCTIPQGAGAVIYYCRCNDPSQYHDGSFCRPCPTPCFGGECVVEQNGQAVCRCPAGATLINGICDYTGGKTVCEMNCGNGVCVQVNGRWVCQCPAGTVLINGNCIPCPIPCQGGTCEPDYAGGAVCICPPETSLVNGECVPRQTLCQLNCVNGVCRLWNGVWQCECPPGTQYINGVCVQIDYCSLGPANKCENGVCVNGVTGYTCQCNNGFQPTPDGQACVQIDYCGTGAPKCANGQCINILGGFRCQCNPGFQPAANGQACVQIDYCGTGAPKCANGQCINILGGFRCQCNPGFQPTANGQACVQIDYCATGAPKCANGQCINVLGGFQCQCNPGFQPTANGQACVPIDYCGIGPPKCANGQCVNIQGGFRCVCNQGFQPTPDLQACVPIDYCGTGPPKCANGRCVNVQGGFRCMCNPGYVPTPDLQACVPTKETICRQNCVDGQCLWDTILGDYVCTCPPGFQLIQGRCTNINECQDPNVCQGGVCIDLNGGFRCECGPNFRPAPDGRSCIPIPPSCVCNGGWCIPFLDGVERCVCPYGYQLQGTSQCVDIDECLADPCLGGTCENSPGSYRCTSCLPNFMLTADGRACVGFNTVQQGPFGGGIPWWFWLLGEN